MWRILLLKGSSCKSCAAGICIGRYCSIDCLLFQQVDGSALDAVSLLALELFECDLCGCPVLGKGCRKYQLKSSSLIQGTLTTLVMYCDVFSLC